MNKLQIKWKFTELDIQFVSTEENFETHVYKLSNKFNVNRNKIQILEDERVIPSQETPAESTKSPSPQPNKKVLLKKPTQNKPGSKRTK